MNLGERIKRYRLFRGKTQRQLGEDVGFKSSTADVRINQYENNLVAPKANIRKKLADALDVDISALSDNIIQSNVDIVRTLFELEEELGIKIIRNPKKTILIFDNENMGSDLNAYLQAWQEEQNNLDVLPTFYNFTHLNFDEYKKKFAKYEEWKAHFPQNVSLQPDGESEK